MKQDRELDAGRGLLLAAIDEYEGRFPDESQVITRFRDFVRREPLCFERSTTEGHITGSAWVVDGRSTHTLLTHHRKLNKWLQLGGHADGDSDVVNVALTEAREESGIDEVSPLYPFIFDLDVHVIPARPNEPEHLHYDVRYVVLAAHTNHVVGEESHDLAWVPISQLHDYTTEESMLRMARKWNALNEPSQ
ncbi:MAG: NUDIX hydrolase [Candidatus Kapabacteria bacterium]|nr:NUDIX hydrolase [Candidatus Kapabacteria bacterium]